MSVQVQIYDVLIGGKQSVLTGIGHTPVYSLLVDSELVNMVTSISAQILTTMTPVTDEDVLVFANRLVDALNCQTRLGHNIHGQISTVSVSVGRGGASAQTLKLIGHVHFTDEDRSIKLHIDDKIAGFGSLIDN